MRARRVAVFSFSLALLLCPATLVVLGDDRGHRSGYQPEDIYQYDPVDLDDITAVCPTDRLLRSRETCQVDGADVQCIRLHCCESYVYIAGRCIPKSIDPCSLQLCEQACEVKDDKIWCTCLPGFRFQEEHYRRRTQPYCVDVDECAEKNGGCEQSCVNDPGGFHCECTQPYSLASDGRRCLPPTPVTTMPEPLPLIRASTQCFAPCDTVSWLSRKVKQLSEQLHNTHTELKKLMENPALKDGGDRFADGTYTYRVLDSTAPLEGGYCRCERGPRGPAGPPGMEGPKGDAGARGPRGQRGPKGSMEVMMLLIADIKHDIRNLEARVYKDGEMPERFNMQKAWRQHRKQERLDQESRTEQELEAYTAPPLLGIHTDGPEGVEITPNGRNGEIPHTDSSITTTEQVKGDPDPPAPLTPDDIAAKLRQFRQLANATARDDDDDGDTDYDYSFY